MLGGCRRDFRRRERDKLHAQGPPDAFLVNAQTEHFGSRNKSPRAIRCGAGNSVHAQMGWSNDGFGDHGSRNNFGMFRSGLNFAFKNLEGYALRAENRGCFRGC